MKGSFLEKGKQFFLQKDSLIICILTGVLLLVIVWPTENGKKKSEEHLTDTEDGRISYQEKNISLESVDQETMNKKIEDSADHTKELERELEEFLKMMEGVGEAKVMITLDSLGEKVLEKDIPVQRSVITENDAQGGARNTNDVDSRETTVYTIDKEGAKIPYVITETLPEIKGITVVCRGGDSVVIQKNITEVIQALFGIEAHKIKIVKMKQIE